MRRIRTVAGPRAGNIEVSGSGELDRAPIGRGELSAGGPTGVEGITPDSVDASSEASARSIDEFDLLGAKIADLLRQAREASDRVRSAADEQAKAMVSEAIRQSVTILEDARTESGLQRAEARELLDEAARLLDVAQREDTRIRQDAAAHLIETLTTRKACAVILDQAAALLVRAEAMARTLAAQTASTSDEAGDMTRKLHDLVEQLNSVADLGKVGSNSDSDPSASAGGVPPCIDLRDSPGSSSDVTGADERGEADPSAEFDRTPPADSSESMASAQTAREL